LRKISKNAQRNLRKSRKTHIKTNNKIYAENRMKSEHLTKLQQPSAQQTAQQAHNRRTTSEQQVHTNKEYKE